MGNGDGPDGDADRDGDGWNGFDAEGGSCGTVVLMTRRVSNEVN